MLDRVGTCMDSLGDYGQVSTSYKRSGQDGTYLDLLGLSEYV